MELYLTDLKFDLSSYCNQKCSFCPFHGYDKLVTQRRFLDYELLVNVATDLKTAGINPKIRFGGSGEPTIHPDFEKIIQLYHGLGFKIKLITNGHKLEKQHFLYGSTLDSIVISVHGDEETHDRQVALNGAYQRLIRGADKLKHEYPGFDLTFHFVITPQNYMLMQNHVNLAKSFGAKPRFQHLNFTEGNQLLGNFYLDHLKEMIDTIRLGHPVVRFVPDLSNDELGNYYNSSKPFVRNPHKCERILTDLSIRSDGIVFMCGYAKLGDLKEDSIVNIIKSELRKRFIEDITSYAKNEGLPENICSRCCYN